jgi:hypothetical protein
MILNDKNYICDTHIIQDNGIFFAEGE